MALCSDQIRADVPVPEKLIEIVDLCISNVDSLKLGDTITINASIRGKLTGNVVAVLALSGGFDYLNESTISSVKVDTLTILTDSIYTISYLVSANRPILSSIEFGAKIIPSDPYIQTPIDVATEDIIGTRNIEIEVFTPEWTCSRVTNVDNMCTNYNYTELTLYSHADLIETENVNINGSLLFLDWWEPSGEGYPRVKGSFANIWLFFRKLNESGTQLYHPVPFQDYPIEGIHYVRTSHNGDFHF